MASGELDEAKRLARHIGIRHETVETAEMSLPAYCENGPNRCYHCKSELCSKLAEVARRFNLAVTNSHGTAVPPPGLKERLV